MSNNEVVIVGSGITGITAAYFEAKKGNAVTLIDSDSRPGGLLKSDFASNQQYFDYGTHIMSETSIPELDDFLFSDLNNKNCIITKKIDTACHFNNKINSKNACVDISNLPKQDYLKACYELLISPNSNVDNLESFFINRFGITIYEKVFKDIVKKFIGLEPNLLSEKIGYLFDMSRVMAFDAPTTSKLVEVEAFNKVLGHHNRTFGVKKYYPRKGGIGFIIDLLMKKLINEGVNIKLSTNIQKVMKEDEKIVSLITKDQEIKVDRLIWTLPSSFLTYLSGVDKKGKPPKFRNTGLYDFTFEKPLNLKSVFINVYDLNLHSCRVTLYQNLSRSENFSCTVEVLADDNIDLSCLTNSIEKELVRMNIASENNQCLFKQYRPIRNGFPILTTEFIESQAKLSRYCDEYFNNVLFLGRNTGRVFFMNDVLSDTFWKVQKEANVN